MAELFLPTLHTFAMNNIFTGSMGAFRFRAAPQVVMATPKEVDFAASQIRVEYWHGPACDKISPICKDHRETKRKSAFSASGGGCKPRISQAASHFLLLPGMTGTGAPVIGRLRYFLLGNN